MSNKHRKKIRNKKQKRLFVILGIIVVMILVITIFIVRNYKESTLEKARKAYDHGDYEKAVQLYQKLLDEGKEDEDIYIGMSEAYVGMNDYEDAKTTLEEGYSVTQSHVIIEKEKELYSSWYKSGTTLELPFDIHDVAFLKCELLSDVYEEICDKLGVEIQYSNDKLNSIDTKYGKAMAWIDDSEGVKVKNLIIYSDYQMTLQILEGKYLFLKIEPTLLAEDGASSIFDAFSFPIKVGDSAEKAKEVFAVDKFLEIQGEDTEKYIDAYCQWGMCSYSNYLDDEDKSMALDINSEEGDIRYTISLDENEQINKILVEVDF